MALALALSLLKQQDFGSVDSKQLGIDAQMAQWKGHVFVF